MLELPLPENYDLNQNISQATEEELTFAAQAAEMNEHFYPRIPQPSGTQVPQAETVPMTVVFNEDRSAAVKAPACISLALKNLAYALAGMLAEGQHRRLNKMRGQVDKKLRSKIEEKKAAHGLKSDGQNYQGNEEQSM